MASSAALTTTHLPILRSELDEWRAQQEKKKKSSLDGSNTSTGSTTPTFATPLSDITNRFPASCAATEREKLKDVVVAFRTRPPLEDEAAAKFHGYEGRDEAAGHDKGRDGEKDGKGDEENVKAAVKDAQNEGGHEEKVEFCAGITVTDAEPGTFVAHVPGYKVRFSFSSFLIRSLVLMMEVTVVRPDTHTQVLRLRRRVRARRRERGGVPADDYR